MALTAVSKTLTIKVYGSYYFKPGERKTGQRQGNAGPSKDGCFHGPCDRHDPVPPRQVESTISFFSAQILQAPPIPATPRHLSQPLDASDES
jgi:hypothetical protein